MNPIEKLFKTDKDLEAEKGIEIVFENAFTVTILRAGGHNRKYTQALEAKTRPFRHQIQRGTLSDEKTRQLVAEAYAEAVIIDWKGEGLPEFNRDNVIQVLVENPEFFMFIQNEANNFALFRAEQVEADAKN